MEKWFNDVITKYNDFVRNGFEVEKSLNVWLTKGRMSFYFVSFILLRHYAFKNIRKRSNDQNFKKLEVLFLEKMDETLTHTWKKAKSTF